jgi:hypothetical protein
MLDLETWGKRPGCDIRSIGACVFQPVAPHFVHSDGPGTFYMACDNPVIGMMMLPTDTRPDGLMRKYPLTRDPDTVQWWSEQSYDAQAAFADPVDLRDALERFRSWIACIGDPRTLRLYAHGPQFDCSILEAAYHAVGLPVPWHYRAPRDTRTVFDLCGVGDHSQWMAQYPVGTAHHALDDAISQARAVCGAMAQL